MQVIVTAKPMKRSGRKLKWRSEKRIDGQARPRRISCSCASLLFQGRTLQKGQKVSFQRVASPRVLSASWGRQRADRSECRLRWRVSRMRATCLGCQMIFSDRRTAAIRSRLLARSPLSSITAPPVSSRCALRAAAGKVPRLRSTMSRGAPSRGWPRPPRALGPMTSPCPWRTRRRIVSFRARASVHRSTSCDIGRSCRPRRIPCAWCAGPRGRR